MVIDYSIKTSDMLDKHYYDSVEKKLTPEQKLSLIKYTDVSFVDINSYLRGKKLESYLLSTTEESIIYQISCLRSAISLSHLNMPLTVYHATSNALFKNQPNFYSTKEFISNAFLSTSISKKVAQSFIDLGTPCSILEIHLPIGSCGIWLKRLSKNPYENEILLRDGLSFEVEDVKQERTCLFEKYTLVKVKPKRKG